MGLNILSLNVLSISSKDLDQFCRQLELEVRWDALLLQEFSFTEEEFIDSADGHIVFAQPPCSGQRRCAIILHDRMVNSIVPYLSNLVVAVAA